MVSYTLVSQKWVAASPLICSDFDSCAFELHPAPIPYEKPDENLPIPLRPIRRFSRVVAVKLEAQCIRSRVSRTDVAHQAGISLGVLNDILAGRSIISPMAAARLHTIFNRDIKLYPVFPPPVRPMPPVSIPLAVTS